MLIEWIEWKIPTEMALNRILNMTLLLWWWHLQPWSSVHWNPGSLVNPF